MILLKSALPIVIVAVVLAVAVTVGYRAWQEKHEDIEPADEFERLSELERAHAAGELNDEELRRVRALLGYARPAGRGESRPPRAPLPPLAAPPPLPGDEGSSPRRDEPDGLG